jgi:hypothetical protein
MADGCVYVCLPPPPARPTRTPAARCRSGPCARCVPSWKRSILTEIYLCHACSYHEIEDGNARALRKVSGEWLRRSLAVNTLGPLLLTQALAPCLKPPSAGGRRRRAAAAAGGRGAETTAAAGGRPPSVVANLSARQNFPWMSNWLTDWAGRRGASDWVAVPRGLHPLRPNGRGAICGPRPDTRKAPALAVFVLAGARRLHHRQPGTIP